MKALLLDIESAPLTVFCWGLREQDISLDQIIDTSYVLCWSAKWLGQDEMMFERTWKKKRSSRVMIQRIHGLISEADAVITYNGIKFDLPVLNREFLLHGLPPPPPHVQIDLIKPARSRFRFASNKLDHLAGELGLGSKAPHDGFMTWIRAMEMDAQAWDVMTAYNKHDVVILERLYYRLLPWLKTHPNLSRGEIRCPNCASDKTQRRGKARSRTAAHQRYQCRSCGSWFRSVASDKHERQQVVAL